MVSFPTAGSYLISFSAAQRGNPGTSKEVVQVWVDGVVVGTLTPAGTSYATETTVPFDVAAGSHTITFAGVDPTGADYTALLDQVGIDYVAPTGVTDPGFEGLSLGTGLSANKYDPTGSAWSFSGTAGVASNGSGFTYGNANALQGTQVGFLQDTGSFSQVVSLSATGFYLIGFSTAQRAKPKLSNQNFEVLVDGMVVGTFTPAGTSYASFTTVPLALVAGTHKITFQGLDTAGGDNTAILDNIQLTQRPRRVSPTPASRRRRWGPGPRQLPVRPGRLTLDLHRHRRRGRQRQ